MQTINRVADFLISFALAVLLAIPVITIGLVLGWSNDFLDLASIAAIGGVAFVKDPVVGMRLEGHAT